MEIHSDHPVHLDDQIKQTKKQRNLNTEHRDNFKLTSGILKSNRSLFF